MMRVRLTMIVVAATAAFACSDSSDAPTGPGTINVPVRFDHAALHPRVGLTGGEEVPNRPTEATGLAVFHIADDGQTLGYTLSVRNIRNVFQAHIHLAPAGQNGGIVAWLYPSTAPTPGPLAGGPIEGLISGGSITSANLVGALAGQQLSALLDAMRNGGAYVNVHTNDGVAPADTGPGDFPGGEIRGQIH